MSFPTKEDELAFEREEAIRAFTLEVIEAARERGLVDQRAYLEAFTIWRDELDYAKALLRLAAPTCRASIIATGGCY